QLPIGLVNMFSIDFLNDFYHGGFCKIICFKAGEMLQTDVTSAIDRRIIISIVNPLIEQDWSSLFQEQIGCRFCRAWHNFTLNDPASGRKVEATQEITAAYTVTDPMLIFNRLVTDKGSLSLNPIDNPILYQFLQ